VFANLYDGHALAEAQNAVVVSFNYRVGALGFLAHPALTAGSPLAASGNYGLLDTVSALKWVRRNAGAFGGDPSHVMVFGESAGAVNTCMLLASPLAQGLFSSALMESGFCHAPPMSTRYAKGLDLAQQIGCSGVPDVAACLRAAPVDSIIQAAGPVLGLLSFLDGPFDPASVLDLPFGPAVDGYFLPDAPLTRFAQGENNQVPIVMGTNSHEAATFVLPGKVTSCLDYSNRITTNFGALAPQIEALYPCNPLDPTSGQNQYIAIVTDMGFGCSTRRALRALATGHTSPLRRYYFSHSFDYGPLALLGAFHLAEVPFVFNSFPALFYVPTPPEVAVSNQIQAYWRTFAATGDPNTAAAPNWPLYDSTKDNALQLDETVSGTEAIQSSQCDFWDAHS
jgi:para-nitrobenzyl esterase